MKHVNRDSLGEVNSRRIDRVLEQRQILADQMKAGFTPVGCEGCTVIVAISRRDQEEEIEAPQQSRDHS